VTQAQPKCTKRDAEARRRSQPPGTATTAEHSIKEGRARPRQHLPPCSVGEQQRTRADHMYKTLMLYKSDSHAQFPVSTGEKRPLGSAVVRKSDTQQLEM
jgi:hypothetical protein